MFIIEDGYGYALDENMNENERSHSDDSKPNMSFNLNGPEREGFEEMKGLRNEH